MISITNQLDLKLDSGVFVIKFWAPWCGPCKHLNPLMEKLNEEYSDISFISVDIDQAPDIARKFKIKSIPTLLFIKDGEEKERVIGVQAITPLRNILNSLVKTQDVEDDSKLSSSTG